MCHSNVIDMVLQYWLVLGKVRLATIYRDLC